MLKMNVSNMCKEVHRVRVLYVHVFVSVYNFLRWNKIIKYKKKNNKREIPAFDTVLFHSNLSSLRRKYLSDVPTDKIVLSSGAKISEAFKKRSLVA